SADARTASAQVAADLAAVNRFLASTPAAVGGTKSLADDIEVDPGHETALTAVLGSLMRAGIVGDLAEGGELLDRHARDGGITLIEGVTPLQAGDSGSDPGEPLLAHVRPGERSRRVIARL